MTDAEPHGRIPALSLWIGSRLGERKAFEWIIEAFEGDKGLSPEDLVRLLQTIAYEAAESETLPVALKTTWRLLLTASRARSHSLGWFYAGHFKQEIQAGRFDLASATSLIEFARPRLAPGRRLHLFEMNDSASDADEPNWVVWKFVTASGSVDNGIASIDKNLLALVGVELLDTILEMSTQALSSAIDLARDAGWIDGDDDLTSLYVSRVSFDSNEENRPTDEDGDERDPDAFDDGFAPLVRVMASSFDAVISKDGIVAQKFLRRWSDRGEALFVRLRAHAGLHVQLWSGRDVGTFLLNLPDLQFWKWRAFPEIAALRALRWSDLPPEGAEAIAKRLLAGPNQQGVGDLDPEVLLYWRDHELARVVDNNALVSGEMLEVVRRRRSADVEFPEHIYPVDGKASSVSFRRMPEGDPRVFDQIDDESLIDALFKSSKGRHFAEGDDAQAYVVRNKLKVAELLAHRQGEPADLARIWELVLSYPHQNLDNRDAARLIVERMAQLIGQLPQAVFDRISDRICYWLDAVDEQLKEPFDVVPLWTQLLPMAAQRENSETAAIESDLSSAALNVPLGHLVSIFLRRCPPIPAGGPAAALPEPMTSQLKLLTGRARAIVANRLITGTAFSYFWRADRNWLQAAVLDPMLSNTREGTPLWEAFSKYAGVPAPSLWAVLQGSIIKQVAAGELSKDALRRLAEMLIVVWSWTKSASSYTVSVAPLRAALGLASDDVRGAAAWQFVQLVRKSRRKRNDKEVDRNSDGDEEASQPWARLGPSFFSDVWPLEPAVQSAKSANDFARLPARAGPASYVEAVRTVLPFLRPFEVWDVDTAFDLNEGTDALVTSHPTETLALLSACISERQSRSIIRLERVLTLISTAKPDLAGDPQFRRLRRLGDQGKRV